MQSRPTEFLDCTSVTLDEFPQLVPPFELTITHNFRELGERPKG